jgi:hypothetical protein
MGGSAFDQRKSKLSMSTFAILQKSDVFLEMEENPASEPPERCMSDPCLMQTAARAAKEARSAETQPLTRGHKKHVSFTELHIREHEVVLGDHPCCAFGLPVALGWEVQSESIVPVDEYEANRQRRRSRDEMRLSTDDRRALLADITEGDLRRVQRKLHRERGCSGNAKKMFFHKQEAPEEPFTVGYFE